MLVIQSSMNRSTVSHLSFLPLQSVFAGSHLVLVHLDYSNGFVTSTQYSEYSIQNSLFKADNLKEFVNKKIKYQNQEIISFLFVCLFVLLQKKSSIPTIIITTKKDAKTLWVYQNVVNK